MIRYSIEPNESITYKLHHEDAHLLVVSKPANVVTMPGLGHDDDSLLNGLFVKYGQELQQLGKSRDFGLLHRLDRETSGLVMIARSKDAYDGMREAFETRAIEKYYWAVVLGQPKRESGVIKRPLAEYEGKLGTKKQKMCRISSAGKLAVTAYRVLSSTMTGSLLECRAMTGRLHQVRVHLESVGAAILGDDLYGPSAVRGAAPRLALHAHRIVFQHPITGVKIDVRSGWPQDLRGLLKRHSLGRPDIPASGAAKPGEQGKPKRGRSAGGASGGVDGLDEFEGDAVGDEES